MIFAMEISKDMGDFVELWHFNKHFIINTKKAPKGKILKIFFLDTFKTTLNMDTIGAFFSKIRMFFSNFKKGQRRRPILPCS